MLLHILGNPQRISKTLARRAVQHYARKLLSKRALAQVSLSVQFDEVLIGKDEYGYCQVDDSPERPREFTIGVCPTLGKVTMLRALAHECVHMRQYVRGEMRDLVRSNSVRWLGEHINPEEIDYFWLPWEIEARGYEMALYTDFMRAVKEKT